MWVRAVRKQQEGTTAVIYWLVLKADGKCVHPMIKQLAYFAACLFKAVNISYQKQAGHFTDLGFNNHLALTLW